jgi:inorganic pyrophosphatase
MADATRSNQLLVFRLDRVLHSPMYYPGDYGFIPSTLGRDGDPLDILVLVSEPTFSGCVMAARPIGYLYMIDEDIPDEKILAVPRGSPSSTMSQALMTSHRT